MIFTITVIISASVCFVSGLIGGGALGYAIGNNRYEQESDEIYERLVQYYSSPEL